MSVLSWQGPPCGVSRNVVFDIIPPIRGHRKMPWERKSADTKYLDGGLPRLEVYEILDGLELVRVQDAALDQRPGVGHDEAVVPEREPRLTGARPQPIWVERPDQRVDHPQHGLGPAGGTLGEGRRVHRGSALDLVGSRRVQDEPMGQDGVEWRRWEQVRV